MSDSNEIFKKNISDRSIHLINSPSISAKDSFLYMLEAGFLATNLSYSEELDNLDAFLVICTEGGEGKLLYEGKEYQLKDGMIFLADCKKYHYRCTVETWGWNILYLYFNGHQAREYYRMIMESGTPVFTSENPKTVKSIFWQIMDLYQKKNKYAEALTSLYITKLLTEILLLSANTPAGEVEYPDFINGMFHYLNYRYNEKITLDMLAERYSVNKFYMAKVFKRYSGTTIYEYLMTVRLNKAKALLRYSNKSMDEIANEVGFYNASYFIKQFREREHITPLFFRKQWK